MAPPIYVKGGAWTNVEDQILRAAVSKYGLTQWARVSSLLPKKTAKQAKARWNEYLNPTINRTEWSQQDDEKLLNLAKLLPNQWRSIASVMGRTATHCLERYQKLLDDVLKDDDSNENDPNAVDTSLQGPGIEALPALGNAFESLPSKPDMEDMDEDDAEMLSEAKARLANTQGKKAKRKERERLMEESRRIALLKKRRELKAAGINISLVLKNRKRRKEFDYNADIPHEHQPPPGLYDTSQEDSQNFNDQLDFQKTVKFKGLENFNKQQKRKGEDEERATKRAKKVIENAAGAISEVTKYQLSKRQALHLPAPESSAPISIGKITSERKSRDGDSLAESKPKISKKKLLGLFRELLAKIPPPKNASPAIVPPIDYEVSSRIGDATVSFEALEKRQSLVVQKGYKIPNPDQIVPSLKQFSQLESEIHEEFKALVTSDYVEFVNPIHQGTILEGLTSTEWNLIEHQVIKELKGGSFDYKPPDLPRFPDIAENVVDLLIALDSRAKEAERVIEEGYAAAEVDIDQVTQELLSNFQELLDTHIDQMLHENILQDEDVALSVRSARLHSMVEYIKSAERRFTIQHEILGES